MTVESLQTLSLIFFILAGVLFLVTVALFFILNIVKVFGYLTGINAKRGIEDIRIHNEVPESVKSSSKQKVTSKFSFSRRLQKDSSDGVVIGTAKLSTSELVKEAMETTVLDQSETTVLETSANETTVLDTSSSETTVLNTSVNETTVLNGSASETTVLSGSNYSPVNLNTQESTMDSVSNETNQSFYIEYEIYFAESTEIIQ